MLTATAANLGAITRRAEFLPVDPALGAMKAPFAHLWAGDEQRHRAFAGKDFQSVRSIGRATADPTRLTGEGAIIGVFDVPSREQETGVRPRVIVQRAIVITAQDFVEIDVTLFVARNDPPAPKIRRRRRADHKVR